jgi:hypothetical protein
VKSFDVSFSSGFRASATCDWSQLIDALVCQQSCHYLINCKIVIVLVVIGFVKPGSDGIGILSCRNQGSGTDARDGSGNEAHASVLVC